MHKKSLIISLSLCVYSLFATMMPETTSAGCAQNSPFEPVLTSSEAPSVKIKNGLNPPAGMFSLCNDLLYALWEFDHGYLSSLQVNFAKSGLYYGPDFGPNWWEYYFEPIFLGKVQGPVIDWVYGFSLQVAPWNEGSGIPRSIAHEFIVKYIHPKKHIVDKVDHFCRENFLDRHVLGVHYRGTDKVCEAPRVFYEDASKVIQEIVDSWEHYHPETPCRIFIATDEQGFIEYAASLWGDQVCFRQSIRSTSGEQIHYGMSHSPYQLGEDAILDMLLLSKSDVMIRTSSNLSLWSTYFNPNIPVIELSHRY